MEPCPRTSNGAHIPVPAVSSRSVQNHARSVCDPLIIQEVLKTARFTEHIKAEKYCRA